MKRWPGILLWPVPVLAGCVGVSTAPIPPIDAAAPARAETATFALG
jgi:hypothetical protein